MRVHFRVGNRLFTVAIRRPRRIVGLIRQTHTFPDVFTQVHITWFNILWLHVTTCKYVVEQDAVNNAETRLDVIANRVKSYSIQTNKELAS